MRGCSSGDRDISAYAVRDIMIAAPKTLPASATLAEAAFVLSDDHVHQVLLVDAGVLVGTIERADLPADSDLERPASSYAVLEGRTAWPDTPAESLRDDLMARGRRRAAVVDEAGRLLGLACLKRSGEGFCSDSDVAAREDVR